MKIKRILFGSLILSLLACNFVTQMVIPPTATPTTTQTATVTASSTPTATPLVPVFVPPECSNTPLATVPPDTSASAPSEVDVTEVPQIGRASCRERVQIS